MFEIMAASTETRIGAKVSEEDAWAWVCGES